MQTGASDSQKFSFRNEDDGYYYSKVPFISQNDIDSTTPSGRRTILTEPYSTLKKACTAGWKG